MKKTLLLLALALLAAPTLVSATVLATGSFEGGAWAPFTHYYDGAALVADSTAPDGSYSLKFTYTSGCCSGSAPDIVDTHFTSSNEVYIQFYSKYSSNWSWNPIQNKQIYIWTDANPVINMVLGTYSTNGDTINFSTQHNSNATLNQFYTSGGWTLTKDVWHKYVVRVKMNSAGSYNGIAQVWVDDILRIDQSGLLIRESGQSSVGINSFAMTPVYGGSGAVPSTQYMWFDDVIVQTTPFGTSTTPPPAPVPPPASLQPAPPSRLSIN